MQPVIRSCVRQTPTVQASQITSKKNTLIEYCTTRTRDTDDVTSTHPHAPHSPFLPPSFPLILPPPKISPYSSPPPPRWPCPHTPTSHPPLPRWQHLPRKKFTDKHPSFQGLSKHIKPEVTHGIPLKEVARKSIYFSWKTAHLLLRLSWPSN